MEDAHVHVCVHTARVRMCWCWNGGDSEDRDDVRETTCAETGLNRNEWVIKEKATPHLSDVVY